jgi:galactokinase
VTIIGGHTDYNGGLVVSAPLSIGTTVALEKNASGIIRLISNLEREPVRLRAGELSSHLPSFWTRYVVGVLLEMGLGDIGLDVSVWSDLPMRRGLASSAALTVATALTAARLVGHQQPPLELALLCQRAEWKHVGVPCGLLDPYTALHAEPGQLLRIDCAAKTHEHVNLPPDLAIVICDSGTDRQLTGSLYKVRQAECQQVAEALGQRLLRGATLEELEPLRDRLPLPTRRAEHFIREMDRVEQFCKAMKIRDYASVKSIMVAAHESCRDLFECSHVKLDVLVKRAIAHPGCVGARLTGAGWGGCTVNFVFRNQVKSFGEAVAASHTYIAW